MKYRNSINIGSAASGERPHAPTAGRAQRALPYARGNKSEIISFPLEKLRYRADAKTVLVNLVDVAAQQLARLIGLLVAYHAREDVVAPRRRATYNSPPRRRASDAAVFQARR